MNSKWLLIGAGLVAIGAVTFVLIRILFGNISDELYKGLHAEAQVQLRHICDLEDAYKQSHGVYVKDLETIGFYQDKEDGNKFDYEVGIADSNRFVARAFAKSDYDRDKQQLVWETTQDCEPKKISDD